MLFLSFGLPFPLFLAFVHVHSAWSFAWIAIAGFLIYLSIPANLLEAQELFPGNVSTVSSLMIGFAWGVAGLALTPLGALADRVGVPTTLTVLAFASLGGMLLTWALPRPEVLEREREAALGLASVPVLARSEA